MRTIVTPHAMQKIDAHASSHCAIPSLVLMENAGRCVVDEMETHFGSVDGTSILVVCGKGNNGGDGFVVARHAYHRGADVTVLLMEKNSSLKGDAETNFRILKQCSSERLQLIEQYSLSKIKKQKFDFIVDAIFGTSFHGALEGKYVDVIRWINVQRASKIISVDVPSGLNAETGEVVSLAVKAHRTVTFAAPKVGFYLGKGKEYSGKISIVDIHIPNSVIEKFSEKLFLTEKNDVAKSLPRRSALSHKHSVGKIFILAGSKGLTGAALLCSQSAMKSGAGAVILGVPESEFYAVAKRTLEVMPFALPSTNEGTFSSSAFANVRSKLHWADAVLLGPGLSQNNETQKFMYTVIEKITAPLIIDADGLNAVAKNLSVLKKRKTKDIVLTPHIGEFSRLAKLGVDEIEKNTIDIVRRFAKEYRVILVLKGAHTIIAEPGGKVFFNATGNAGMATAGSGDVLAGIIASLIGQGNSPLHAAINGVFIHGEAGDTCKEKIGIMGMTAKDILNEIPFTLKKYF